jgi:hypothetical protein
MLISEGYHKCSYIINKKAKPINIKKIVSMDKIDQYFLKIIKRKIIIKS